MLAVCCGMIRSGSTLQYNLVKNVLEVSKQGQGEGFFSRKKLASMDETLSSWDQDTKWHVIKTHEPPPDWENDAGRRHYRYFYIYRDLRDVAVSAKNKFGWEDEELLSALDRAIGVFNHMHSFDNVLWQKYEDVINTSSAAVNEIGSSFGLSLSSEVVNSIADQCSLERTEKIIANLKNSLIFKIAKSLKLAKFFFKQYDSSTLLHGDHISSNRGAPGTWKTNLSADEIDKIQEIHKDWFRTNGYLEH